MKTALKKVVVLEEDPKTITLVRALRVEIAKPLGMTWDELGNLLRDRRAVMHRMINAGTALLWSRHYDDEHEGEKPRALEAVKRELSAYQGWCALQAKKTKDLKEKEMLERRSKMVLASSITDAVQVRCSDAVRRWFKEGQTTHVPSAKKGSPIFVRDGGWKLQKDGDGFKLGMRLVGATKECAHPGMVTVALRPSSGKHYGTLQAISSGAMKAGNCQVVYEEGARRESGGTGKWYAILSYSDVKEVGPPPPEKGRVLIVHRGVRNFLYALCSDGRTRELRGGKFATTRFRLSSRMKDVKNIRAFERGSGAKGHGTTRRYETHDALDGKLKNVTKTFCQQGAAWVLKCARDLGVRTIYIEEYGGQEPSEDRGERRFLDHFPYYQLKSSIAWACKRDGFTLREYAATFISGTCPSCGNQDASQHNVRTGVFHCKRCGFERGVDWVAAFNGARNSKIDVGLIEKSLSAQKKLSSMLKDQK